MSNLFVEGCVEIPIARERASLTAERLQAGMSESTGAFDEDFGQKIDLCVKIREILRNYPEGTRYFLSSYDIISSHQTHQPLSFLSPQYIEGTCAKWR